MADSKTPRAMHLDFGSILATSKHSDFVIECGGYCFKTHKAILCAASPFFNAAIEWNFKTTEDIEESDKAEETEGSEENEKPEENKMRNKMRLPDDHPEVVARLLIFIYTGCYFVSPVSKWKCDGKVPFADIHTSETKPQQSAISKKSASTWQGASFIAIAMYQIADKTLIDDLRWASRDNFLSSIRPDRDSDSVGNRFWAEKEMKDVISIIKSVYESTRVDDWMLHDPIVHRMLIGIQIYECLKWEPYQKLLEDVPRLAVEIATSQLAAPRLGKRCKTCHTKTQQRLWRCKCGHMISCDEEDCSKLRQTRSICDKCAVFGSCS